MKVTRLFFLIVGFAGIALAANQPESELPFWRAKPKVFDKILNERAIIVSVNAQKKSAQRSNLRMVGGGLVKASVVQAFLAAQQYENLKKVSDHIVEVKFNAKANELYVHTQAFQYHARMFMKVEPDRSHPESPKIKFHVVRGHFTGLVGEFTFDEQKPQQTLLGFWASYDYEKLPMPEFFVEFGLEVVLQKVAGMMRTFLEKPGGL